jgi:hypothetical protein
MRPAMRACVLAMHIFVMAFSCMALAAAPCAGADLASVFEGQWELVEDDSDDIPARWHGAVREKINRDARRAASRSPMALPANPHQHINLPLFLATFSRVVIHAGPQNVVIEQTQFRPSERRSRDDRSKAMPAAISREINLNPQASSVSLREAARKPPTMFIGGWEKDALVIETTTDEGLLIEERWSVMRDDDEETLRRKVRLRSSIWGERVFEQAFVRKAS